MAAVEQVAQLGLACVTHMSIEARDNHVILYMGVYDHVILLTMM